MIKYCGRVVVFIQYMPKKPIKHGIKVFALCCAYTGYLLGYEVYLGKDTETNENSALHVVDRLITNADLVTTRVGYYMLTIGHNNTVGKVFI